MAENLGILTATVSLLIRAVPLAVRFSGRVRERSLKGLPTSRSTGRKGYILPGVNVQQVLCPGL